MSLDLSGFDLAAALDAAGIIVQIFFVNLLLSADNALLIALACRSLPPDQTRRAMLLGTAGAVLLRIVMTVSVLYLLEVPYLKLVAALLLLAIAVKLTLGAGMAAGREGRTDMLGAIVAIVLADAVMSLDNVVAIAALAQDSVLLLGFGLLLSIPMLVYGSTLIRTMLDDNRALVILGGMFLGWIAGGIGVSDPSVAGWVAAAAPALVVAVPLACAVFVLWESRILTPVPAVKGGRDG